MIHGSSLQKKSIIFYFEASQEKGLGQLFRCRSLAIEFSKYENINIFVSTTHKNLVEETFDGLLYKWLIPEKIYGSIIFDIIMVDISDYRLLLQRKLKERCFFSHR